MAFPLFALLLLAQDAPVATAKAHVPPPAPSAAAPAAAATGQTAPDGELLPQGAPADDFGFVAWCDGVLAGHMDIAERVKDVLPIDEVQQKVGKAYLRAYVRALDGSAEGRTEEGRRRADQLRQDGWSKWDKARAADHTLAAETYLSYQLPGRCEHAAIRLSKNPNLFKLAPSVDDVGAVRTAVRGPSDAEASSIPAASRPFMKAAASGSAPAKAVVTPVSAPAVVSDAASSAPVSTASTPAAAAAISMLPAQPKPIPAPTATTMGAASAAPAAAEPLAPAAPAPTKAAAVTAPPAKAPAAEDKRIVKMPKKGHLLPPFLRGKKDKDEDADK